MKKFVCAVLCLVAAMLSVGCSHPQVPSKTVFELLSPAPHVAAAAPSPLAERIAAGHFDYVNPNINERNFPSAGPVADVSDMLIVSQKDLGGKDMTTAEIESAIDRKVYRPAMLVELLAYAKSKWNGKDRVVALGSSWVSPDGDVLVPCLLDVNNGRSLLLRGHPEIRWGESRLFLVVRK